jgi:hypothetical protein
LCDGNNHWQYQATGMPEEVANACGESQTQKSRISR